MILDRRRSSLEAGAVVLVLLIVALAAYGSHTMHGGFLSDMWSNRALYVFAPNHGFFDLVSYVTSQPNIAVRPLQGLYLVLLNEVFGAHVHFWLAWLVASNVIMCLTLFALLRKLSLGVADAGAIAVLLLLFPATNSLRFWLATIWAPLSLAMVMGGFLLALYAFEAKSRRAELTLHALSLTLFVASLLLYEVALLIMLASVLLYSLRVPWRRAAKRWLVDCAVLIPITLTVTLSSSSGHEETELGIWHHATTIFSQGRTLFVTEVLPLGAANWYLLLLLTLVPAVALLVYRWLPSDQPTKVELRRWLLAMAAGLVVVILGYAIYIPGTDYYIPLGPGIADRINGGPAIGWVVVLYAGLMLAATLALRGMPRARTIASAIAILASALLAIGWSKTIADYSGYFTRAYQEDERVLAVMRGALPHPPPGSTIWTFGQPVEIVAGVPVFGNTWDMTGSVRLAYDDPSLNSYVGAPETTFVCGATGLVPAGAYAVEGHPDPTFGSPYGKTYFLDTNSGRVSAIESRRGCIRAARSFPLSPPYAAG